MLLFLGWFFPGLCQQKEVSKLLKAGDTKMAQGDYIYALSYYQQAMTLDSNTIDVLWKTAEANRAYKDYRKAAYYYGKVFERENTRIYPESILRYGLMQKQNGEYEAALKSFKKAVRLYKKDKKGYLYLKAKQETESTLWAITNVRVEEKTHFEKLPDSINTPNSEFGHTIYNNLLYFSSLRADSINENEAVIAKEYTTKIYTSEISKQQFLEGNIVKDLSPGKKLSTGNGSFSLDKKRFYFSACHDNNYNYQCQIAVAKFHDGQFSDMDTLGEIINFPGVNTTMPAIGKIDNQEVLFFSSDRDKNGKMDLYFSYIRNGNQYSNAINISKINSHDNEITPFWDEQQQRLYFASDWFNGFGGYDVFYSNYEGKRFLPPINAGQPVNSPANDYYFFNHGDSSFVTSNRIGVKYSKNPTCCTDIFLKYPIPDSVITKKETLEDLNKRLPVTLYFHNDWPDPKTTNDTTSINYIDNYRDYRALLPIYKKEYSKGLKGENAEQAQDDIEDFFIEKVDKGVQDLALFQALMLEELNKGISLELTIKGFASPLAKTDYNVHLTQRRIQSLLNYLLNYDDGVFKKYIQHTAENGAMLKFKEIPFGEYNAEKIVSDNINDLKNSVYSRSASLERKIEIQSVNILSNDSSNVIDALTSIHHFGKIPDTHEVSTDFQVKNTSQKLINLQNATYNHDLLQLSYSKENLKPGETITVTVTLNPRGQRGNLVLPIFLKTIESNQSEQIVITAEIQPAEH